MKTCNLRKKSRPLFHPFALQVLTRPKGPFNNDVDKMRGGGGQKMSVFVQAHGIKTVHAGGRGGQKMAKLYPRSC